MSVTKLRDAIHVVEDDVFGFASMLDRFDARNIAILKARVRAGTARAPASFGYGRAAALAQFEEKCRLRTFRVTGREVFVDEDEVEWDLVAVTGGAMDETG